jgi:hypothetical protein
MPPLIDNQPPLQPPSYSLLLRNGPNQRLAHHLRQKNRQCIIVPEPWNLNRHLHPRPLSRHSVLLPVPAPAPSPVASSPIASLRGGRLLAHIPRRRRPFDLRLNPDDSLGAVGEPDARAAVGARQDVCFGGQRAELGRGAAVGADGGVGEGERGVEVGQLGGRDVRGLRGRGGLALRGHFCICEDCEVEVCRWYVRIGGVGSLAQLLCAALLESAGRWVVIGLSGVS